MHGISHQQVTAPWSAPFPAAAPSGPAQQLPSPPNTASDRSSPPAGSITRRPKYDPKTGRQAGEDIFVCWLTPAQPNPFGRKFRAWQRANHPVELEANNFISGLKKKSGGRSAIPVERKSSHSKLFSKPRSTKGTLASILQVPLLVPVDLNHNLSVFHILGQNR